MAVCSAPDVAAVQGHSDANVGGLRALFDVNLALPGPGPLQRGVYVLCHLRNSGWFSRVSACFGVVLASTCDSKYQLVSSINSLPRFDRLINRCLLRSPLFRSYEHDFRVSCAQIVT